MANFTSHGKPVALTLGFFDGIHRGHCALIEQLVATAKRHQAQPVVLTFDSHPFRVVCPDKLPPIIMTLTERIGLLEELGVGSVILQPFDRDFAEVSAEAFIQEILIKKLRARFIIGGYDCHFGKNREGDHEMLQRYAPVGGYEFYDVPPMEIGGEIVSSTTIRKAISAGEFNRAALFLGRPWTIWTHVVEGHGIGRVMGFPTANLAVGYLVLPHAGVYASTVYIYDKACRALMYVGTRPTFTGNETKVVCEVYVLDFSGDLYQEWLRVQPLKCIRGDRRFETLDQL